MSNVSQQTKLQDAEGKLEAAKNRIEEINTRLDEVRVEIDNQGHELAKVAAAGGDVKKIHSRTSSLRQELNELKDELAALKSKLPEFQAEIKQVEVLAAAETVEILSKEITPRGLRIFKLLDQLHIELCELEQIENKIKEARIIAGDAAKPLPEDTLSIFTKRIEENVMEAMEQIIRDGGFDYEKNKLALHGIDIRRNRRAEFGTDKEIQKGR